MKTIPLILISLLIITSCKKTVFDFRHKYIGDFRCNKIDESYQYSDTFVLHSESQFNLNVDFGHEKTELKLIGDNGLKFTFNVDKKGALYYDKSKVGSISKKGVNFSTGSFLFFPPPNGGWYTTTIEGSR